MSSRKFDTALDDLFRQALAPIADQEAPANAWDRLIRTVRVPPVERATWKPLSERFVTLQRGYSAAWHRFTAWAQCFMTLPTYAHPFDILGIRWTIPSISFCEHSASTDSRSSVRFIEEHRG
ncbi:MAG: hypothetical protein J7M39_00635 [Anaerolineae bacterium]|nr:hypothetical protein [Anaerolineae bacterium]